MRQALLDLRLPTNGFRTRRKQREEFLDQMLDAARWLFVNRHPAHVFNPEHICERLGVDVRMLAKHVFEKLPLERQDEIRDGLRHYRCSLLAAA